MSKMGKEVAQDNTHTLTPEAQTTPQKRTAPVTQIIEALKQKSWIIIGLIMLVLILSVATSFFAYQNYQLKKLASQPKPPSPPMPTSGPIASPTNINKDAKNLVKNVKTYRDNKYNFSFEYPLDWDINKVDEKHLEVYDLNSQATLLITVLNEEDFLNNPERVSCHFVYIEEHQPAILTFVTRSGEKFYCYHWKDEGQRFDCQFSDKVTISDEHVQKVILKSGEPAEEKKVAHVCERNIMKIGDYYYDIRSLFYCHRKGEVALEYKCNQPLVNKFSEVTSIIESLNFTK